MVIIFSRIKPALLLTGILISCVAAAQVPPDSFGRVYSCQFNYSEAIQTDYSGLLQSGTSQQKRKDSIFYSGKLELQYMSDSVVHLYMVLQQSFSTLPASIPREMDLYIKTDSYYRANKIVVPDSVSMFLPLLQAWLGELHFRMPAAVSELIEYKGDGDFVTGYMHSSSSGNTISMEKQTPVYVSKPSARQTIIIDSYLWKGVFDTHSRLPLSIHFSEKKKQVLGRKVLACVNRKLEFVCSNKAVTSNKKLIPADAYREFPFYNRLSDNQRKARLAVSLLGRENFSTLKQKLLLADSLSNEARFRLKSMFRSLLILDSILAKDVSNLLQDLPQTSAAHEILENAIIESAIPAAEHYILTILKQSSRQYDRLKDLLIKVSLAEAFTGKIALQLTEIFNNSTDPRVQSLAGLALSNYAITIRDKENDLYTSITQTILKPYTIEIKDTTQYLYLAGNAGVMNETDRIIQVGVSNKQYKDESIIALRHISNSQGDSAVENYLLDYRGPSDIYASLMTDRKYSEGFTSALISRIIKADQQQDSTMHAALRFILDNTWQRRIDTRQLTNHEFKVPAYRREMNDFIRQSSLCE